MTGSMIGIVAREIMGRPNAELASLTIMDLERDGFDGVKVELADVPPCLSGKRKGKPNWRKASNIQPRLFTTAELDAAIAAWSERTGLCSACAGSAEQFVRWHHIEGLFMKPCETCDGTGKRPS